MDDHFRVGMRVELVPARFELLSQLQEIVNFAVKHDPYTPVFIVDGLPPAGKINDAEPPHAQTDGPLGIDAFIVRPAVHDGLAHAMDVGSLNHFIPLADKPGYSAHCATSCFFVYMPL